MEVQQHGDGKNLFDNETFRSQQSDLRNPFHLFWYCSRGSSDRLRRKSPEKEKISEFLKIKKDETGAFS